MFYRSTSLSQLISLAQMVIPRDPTSLHHIGQNPNEYSTAIQAFGEIIQDYDSDKQFPCYGFGAKIPPRGILSQNFHLSLAPSNPNIRGIEHILSAYQRTSKVVKLYGPTNLSPVIGEVSKIVDNTASHQCCFSSSPVYHHSWSEQC